MVCKILQIYDEYISLNSFEFNISKERSNYRWCHKERFAFETWYHKRNNQWIPVISSQTTPFVILDICFTLHLQDIKRVPSRPILNPLCTLTVKWVMLVNIDKFNCIFVLLFSFKIYLELYDELRKINTSKSPHSVIFFILNFNQQSTPKNPPLRFL